MDALTIQISRERLTEVQERYVLRQEAAPPAPSTTRSTTDKPSYRYAGPTSVPDTILTETRSRYPECRCEELGLEAGMPTSRLIELEEGCAGSRQRARLEGRTIRVGDSGWVCPRLDVVRKRCGR